MSDHVEVRTHSDYHRVADLPRGEFLFDSLNVPIPDRVVLMTRRAFEGVGDYTRSQPTAPHAGRVYRKALHWTQLLPGGDPAEANWWVYVVMDAPASDPRGGQLHHPFRPLIVTS